MTRRKPVHVSRTMVWLGVYMSAKGAVLLLVTAGVLHFLHKDLETVVTRWVESLRIDPENRLVSPLLTRLGMVEPHQLKQLSVITAGCAALFLVQGIGMWLGQRWAAYLTLVGTTLLIPIEIFEICSQPTTTKIALLAINLVVVAFVWRSVRQTEA